MVCEVWELCKTDTVKRLYQAYEQGLCDWGFVLKHMEATSCGCTPKNCKKRIEILSKHSFVRSNK